MRLLQQLLILEQRARIGRVILARSELQRIDEDTCHHAIAAITRRGEQAHVASVQIAHGRHEGDAQAGAAPLQHLRAHGIDRGQRFHRACGIRSNVPEPDTRRI